MHGSAVALLSEQLQRHSRLARTGQTCRSHLTLLCQRSSSYHGTIELILYLLGSAEGYQAHCSPTTAA